MRNFIKTLSLIAMLLGMLPLSGCYDKERFEDSLITDATITYTYTVNQQMLDNLDITAIYIDQEGQNVHKPVTETISVFKSRVYGEDNFPAERTLSFEVTPKPGAVTDGINYTTTIDLEVNCVHKDDAVQTTHLSKTETFSSFNDYQKYMSQIGYRVFIRVSGEAHFSIDN